MKKILRKLEKISLNVQLQLIFTKNSSDKISQLIFLLHEFHGASARKHSRKSWEDCPSLNAADYGAVSFSCKKTTCSLICPDGQSSNKKSKYKCKKGSWKGTGLITQIFIREKISRLFFIDIIFNAMFM